MKIRLFFALFVVFAIGADAISAEIFFMFRDEFALSEGDEAQLALFEDRGDTVDLWDNARIQSDEFLALETADEADLVWVDESVSSGRLAAVRDTITPLINNENYGCDSLGMSWQSADLGRADGHGSPGTLNPDGSEIIAGTSFGTGIQIINDTHPIALAAGLQNGVHAVYDDEGGRRSWCVPGETADIVAILPEFAENYPTASTLFVYETGDELPDGGEAEGMRIGLFLSDTNRGPELEFPEDEADGTGPGWEATLLTEAGKRLINATIDYALGIKTNVVAGDYNGNGQRDLEDLDLMASGILANDVTFDLDSDGDADFDDRTIWVQQLANSYFGDSDFNGEFNSADFVAVFVPAKYETDQEATWAEGDWSGDKVFNSSDFVVAFQGAGYEKGPRDGGLKVVPEPSSIALFLCGLLFSASPLRRRN